MPGSIDGFEFARLVALLHGSDWARIERL
jgi:hypothetical protein